MYQLTSRKTNKVSYLNDADYEKLKAKGWLSKFKAIKLQPKIIKPPDIIKPETKPKTKKKND